MFIELTEILRCPRSHEHSYMICVPITMDGRRVVRGAISCPVCQSDFPILEGVTYFSPPAPPPEAAGVLTGEAARAFLGLEGAGGYVVLIGSAARLASELGDAHVVAVNPPAGARAPSMLRVDGMIPLKQPSVRGIIVGPEAVVDPWLREAASVVLPGLRVVLERENIEIPGMTVLASGAGVTVLQR